MIRPDDEAVSDLIGHIYAAAYDPGQWPGIAVALERMFGGSRVCLVRQGPDLRLSDAVCSRFDAGFNQIYIERFSSNVWAEAAAARPVGTVCQTFELVPRAVMEKEALWHEWMVPQDMHGGLSCKLLSRGASEWFLDIQRGSSQPEFDRTYMELLARLALHLRRAHEIGGDLQGAPSLVAALAQLPFGIIIVDSRLRVLSMNREAEALLERGDSVIGARAGVLHAGEHRKNERLQALVVDACGVRGRLAGGTGGTLLLHAPGQRETGLALSVCPVADTQREPAFLWQPCAAIFISEMTLRLAPGFERQVRDLFGLTPKETSIAAALASGRSLRQAAEDESIAFSTARSHLESIFRKTGVRQQTQLVALLKSMPPIPGP